MDPSNPPAPSRQPAPPETDTAEPAGRGSAPGQGPDVLSAWVRWTILALGLAALAGHFYCVTFNWHSGSLVGHEFRQSQTALIADHIDRQNNFSLHYDTPVFGKPWGAPLEWPLYEWCVVLLKRTTDQPAFEAARTVSVAFFYLTLPAVFLLLGQAGLPRGHRWLPLALILCCPVYLFYSRAFLIESTVLCFSVWFLALFVQLLRTPRLHWLVLTSVCGAIAGMMKSLTFAAWVVPAAAYGGWTLWRNWREHRTVASLWRPVAWGCGAMVLPLTLTLWWTHFADSIKEQNPATLFLTSRALGVRNYGTFSLAARLSGDTWREMAVCWNQALMPPWMLGMCALGGILVAGRHRRAVLIALALFLAPQLAIPYAYARQDYYFFAPSIFLMVGFGFALLGLLERPWPAWWRAILLLLPFTALATGYLQPGGYRNMQKPFGSGRTGLAQALRAATPENGVLIIAGADWDASIAYQSGRRAFMITNGREWDRDFVERQIAALADENIAALVLAGSTRDNTVLAKFIAGQTELDPSPIFSHGLGDVYLNRALLPAARERLASRLSEFPDITLLPPPASPHEPAPAVRLLTAAEARREFPLVTPSPVRCAAKFGFPLRGSGPDLNLGAHPDARLWVPVPAGASRIVWEFGLDTSGSPHADGATDGVDFVITAENEGGESRRLFRRALRPGEHAADRGLQRCEIEFTPQPGEVLRFETRPRATHSYDWAYWKQIEVH